MATVVIAAWEKDLNVSLAKQVLAGDVVVDIVGDMAARPFGPEQPP